MGYSKNPRLLAEIRPYLSALEEGRPQRWTLPPASDKRAADRWAYRIRQAFYIANLYPERYPLLAAASRRFVLEIISPTEVQARVKANLADGVVAVDMPESAPVVSSPPPTGTPDTGLGDPSGANIPVSIVGPRTHYEIIQHWLSRQQEQPTQTPIIYPNAELDEAALTKLSKWASSLTPRWYVLTEGPGQSLTLSPRTIGMPATWSPSTSIPALTEER